MNGTGMNASDTRAMPTASRNRMRLHQNSAKSGWQAVYRAAEVNFPMSEVRDLAARGEPDTALDLVFDQLDDLLLDDRFEECAAVLHTVDPTRLPPVVAVGFLAITCAADDRLREARSALRHRIEMAYQPSMPADDLEQLLRGL